MVWSIFKIVLRVFELFEENIVPQQLTIYLYLFH